MKPLAGFIGYNQEWRELAQVISRVIMITSNITIDFYLNNCLSYIIGYLHAKSERKMG